MRNTVDVLEGWLVGSAGWQRERRQHRLNKATLLFGQSLIKRNYLPDLRRTLTFTEKVAFVLLYKMSLAGGSVAPHLTLLRRVGYCRLEGAEAGAGILVHRLHALYCGFTLLAICTYFVQQGVYAYQERHDMAKLVPVLFLFLCHMTCIAKKMVFHLDPRHVDQIIASLDEAAFNSRSARDRALLRETAAGALRLLRPYVGCAIATCVLWVVLPLIYRLQGHRVQFPFWMPVDYNQPLKFSIVLSYTFYVTTLVAVGNTTMDAFIATILSQCKTQIRILRLNFEDLPERAKKEATNSVSYEANLTKLFIDCIQHFQKISETTDKLLSVFGLAILVQFAVGGWILCMAAYKLVSVNVFSFDFASTTLFLVCILTELFLYCYYGNEVTVESDRVVQSIYSMEWLHAPLHFKRSLVLTMERAKRPLRPAAGHLIPLSLDTFVTIMKSSYSFYAVLRQTK